MKRHLAKIATLSSIATAAVLSACGGGDNYDNTANPSTPSLLKVSGTAAVGAAMANASIKVTCAAGSGTATADANGVYTVTITDGALPCVLTATSSDGLTELHSVAAGTGHADTTANITPLSELLVAKLGGTDPKAFVAGFTGTTTISASEISAAQTALLQTLTAAGVDTSAVADIVGGTISAGSGTGYDGVLDKLKAAIDGAGVTMAELTAAVSTTSGAGSTTSSSTVTTVLAPAAAECAGLKSGPMRLMRLGSMETFPVQVDAKAMTVAAQGQTFTLTKNDTCDYTISDDSSTRMLVSRTGIAVLVAGTGLDGEVSFVLPEQKLDVAALAGSYDIVRYGTTFDSEAGDYGTTEFAADGKNGVSVNCPTGVATCVEDTRDKGTLVANAEGGFDYVEGGVSQARVFAFRNASGRNLLVAQSNDGTTTVLAAKDNLALPAVGKVSSYWQFIVTPAGGLGAVTADSNTIVAADSATGRISRQTASDGHFDNLVLNKPFAGVRMRALNDCTSSMGAAFDCNSAVQLPFGGLAFIVSVDPIRRFGAVAIDKP